MDTHLVFSFRLSSKLINQALSDTSMLSLELKWTIKIILAVCTCLFVFPYRATSTSLRGRKVNNIIIYWWKLKTHPSSKGPSTTTRAKLTRTYCMRICLSHNSSITSFFVRLKISSKFQVSHRRVDGIIYTATAPATAVATKCDILIDTIKMPKWGHCFNLHFLYPARHRNFCNLKKDNHFWTRASLAPPSNAQNKLAEALPIATVER